MTSIRPSAELRNNYSEISDYCHSTNETVFITKNGQGDLAVMSINEYDVIKARLELYEGIARGLKDKSEGKIKDATEALSEIKNSIGL